MKNATRNRLAWLVAMLAVAWMLVSVVVYLSTGSFADGWLIVSSVWYVAVFLLALMVLFATPLDDPTNAKALAAQPSYPEVEVLFDASRARIEAHAVAGTWSRDLQVLRDQQSVNLTSVEVALDAVKGDAIAPQSPRAAPQSTATTRPATAGREASA